MKFWRIIDNMQYMSESGRHIYAKMSGDLFVLSIKRGYDSEDFIRQIMTSEFGNTLYAYEKSTYWWLAHTVAMEEIEKGDGNFKFKKTNNFIDADVMWYAGYLYSYWTTHYKVTANYMYSKAPIEYIEKMFGFFHTQGYDYVISYIENPIINL